MQKRNRGADVDITPEMMKEFDRLFSDWKDEYPNAEALEEGGLGETEAFARQCLKWARRGL